MSSRTRYNFNPDHLPIGLRYLGEVQSVTNLPNDPMVGDVVYARDQQRAFAWVGVNWSNLVLRSSSPQITYGLAGEIQCHQPPPVYVTDGIMTHENKLTYRGISFTIESEHNIAEMFLQQHNLTKQDMGMFKMLYPEEFKQFREGWAHRWAIERAKEEFDEWELDYYEKKTRRDYP